MLPRRGIVSKHEETTSPQPLPQWRREKEKEKEKANNNISYCQRITEFTNHTTTKQSFISIAVLRDYNKHWMHKRSPFYLSLYYKKKSFVSSWTQRTGKAFPRLLLFSGLIQLLCVFRLPTHIEPVPYEEADQL